MGVCTGISARSSVSEKSLEQTAATFTRVCGPLSKAGDAAASGRHRRQISKRTSAGFHVVRALARRRHRHRAGGRTDRPPAQLERAQRRAFGATANNALMLEDQSGHRLAMKKPGGWGAGFTEKAWVGPGTKKPGLRTGLLQLDAIQTSRRPTCGERRGNDIAPAGHQDCQTRNPVPGSGATPAALLCLALLYRRVMHRRRQGLRVDGLTVVEAAAQHQGGREDGKGQNGAHVTKSP